MQDDAIVQLENKFYISANSTYADNRIKVLNHSDTFGIFDRYGDIRQIGDEIQGIYHQGTRFLSESEFRINNFRPLLLSSSVKDENEILSVDQTNQLLAEAEGWPAVLKSTIHIRKSKFIRDGACYEKIEFINYSASPCRFTASFAFHGDFRDIFEVRGIKREKKGELFEIRHEEANLLVIRYMGLDQIERSTNIHFYQVPSHWETQEKAIYQVELQPQQHFIIDYVMTFNIGNQPLKVPVPFDEARTLMETDLEQAQLEFAHVFTSNEQLNHWVKQSQADLISLLAKTSGGRYPFAGVPWYNTPFGRDGIITAYETLWAAPQIARDVLLFLARYQATEVNSYQDAEPGKVIHEMRGGEMVELNEIPFKRYY